MPDRVAAGVLGPAEAFVDGVRVALGAPRQRAVFSALLLSAGRPVSPDRLIDLVWREQPPPGAANTLQGYIHGLRAVLEPGRRRRETSQRLVFDATGYALRVEPSAVDVVRFEHAVVAATDAAAPADVVRTLDEALSWWRGSPYADLGDADAAVAERARLDELRMLALELRAQANLDLGRHATLAGELEALTQAHPLRERLWILRATALARSGRQADALGVLRRIRHLLDEELGLEPSAAVRALELQVLRQEVPITAAEPVVRVEPAAPVDSPLAGREPERALIRTVLAEAAAGRPQFVVLTGDPGIGKTRLASATAQEAQRSGFVVASGRCAQDEGSPSLWPWESVLTAIGSRLPAADGADPQAAFRVRAAAGEAIRNRAQRAPLLVILDDLQWADLASLALLRFLVESTTTQRLCLLVTWRADADAALVDVSAALARRHVLRLDLVGLAAEAVHGLVAATGVEVTSADAADLRRRTDGNPYFALEYARLVARAGPAGSLKALLAEADPPRGVRDVLLRRLAALPGAGQQLLQVAAVLGRDVEVAELSVLAAATPDGVLAGLEEAAAAGLVREVGVDSFRFSHALLQETAYGALSLSRRARLHAVAAEVIGARPGRESEAARHAFAAGPSHVGRAWRAGLSAADQAGRAAAFEDAVTWTGQAVQAVEADAAASPIDRYEVHLAHARALRSAGNWLGVPLAVHRAIAEIEGRGDPERLLAAAALPTDGALWLSVYHGGLDRAVVSALQQVLAELPEGDSPARCRALLALAAELYYSTTAEHREELAGEAVAIARRLGDPDLLLSSCLAACTATWRAGTAGRRLGWAAEAVDLARAAGDGPSLATAGVLRAAAGVEFGTLPEAGEAWLPDAAQETVRHRHGYARLLLLGVEASWSAARGDRERLARAGADTAELSAQLNLAQSADTVTHVRVVDLLWSGRHAALADLLRGQPPGQSLPLTALLVLELCRADRLDEAATLLAHDEAVVWRDLATDNWVSPLQWACTAELSLALGRPDLAAAAGERLAPLAGRPATAGSTTFLGPADAFLACAAAARSDLPAARRHADDAAELIDRWDLPPVRRWLGKLRTRYSF